MTDPHEWLTGKVAESRAAVRAFRGDTFEQTPAQLEAILDALAGVLDEHRPRPVVHEWDRGSCIGCDERGYPCPTVRAVAVAFKYAPDYFAAGFGQ